MPCTKKLKEVLEFDVVSCPSVILLDGFILYFFSRLIHNFSTGRDTHRGYITPGIAGGRLAPFLRRDKKSLVLECFLCNVFAYAPLGTRRYFYACEKVLARYHQLEVKKEAISACSG